MSSKYGIGQEVKWLGPNFHLFVGTLDDGEWTWNEHPLPHEAKCNLRESGLFVEEDGMWSLSPDVVEAVQTMAEERGYDVEEIFVDE